MIYINIFQQNVEFVFFFFNLFHFVLKGLTLKFMTGLMSHNIVLSDELLLFRRIVTNISEKSVD